MKMMVVDIKSSSPEHPGLPVSEPSLDILPPASVASLYIHIPFCVSKCHYCAFNSYARNDPELFERYVAALESEWLSWANPGTELSPRPPVGLETLYLGGGTPSVLPASLLDRLFTFLSSASDMGQVREATMEVNPGTATREILDLLASASSPIDRVSMGVQTMDARRLKKLGRVHTPDDVRETVRLLREAGVRRLNLDLIYGQPEQTMDGWLDDVRQVLDLDPDHVSLYALQFEEGTVFRQALDRGRLAEAPEDLQISMFHAARALLEERGLHFYEISNACRPGGESLHNLGYWRNDPYFGIGAGAYGGLGGVRYRNEESPDLYIERVRVEGRACGEVDFLDGRAIYVETLSSGLRMTAGVDLDEVARKSGLDPRDCHGDHLESMTERGLAKFEGNRFKLTWDGLWLLDSLMLPFLDPAPGLAGRSSILP